MRNKFLLGLLFVLMIVAGGVGGWWLKNCGGVIIRVGQRQSEVDYDLQSALDFLSYQLKKEGYRVGGFSYNGDLYPAVFNNARVNIFVRGYKPFYDVRMSEKAKNVMYVHRTAAFYQEEMRNYDYYLTSQKMVFNGVKREIPISFFGGGAVPHERLKPDYRFDVLYIYEVMDNDFYKFLMANYAAKVYSGIEFMGFSQPERERLLSEAKVVMYNTLSLKSEIADSDDLYVPYAVYDIMSYGRPLLTSYRYKLHREFKDLVGVYNDDTQSAIEKLTRAFEMSDEQREKMAGIAREKLLRDQQSYSLLRGSDKKIKNINDRFR